MINKNVKEQIATEIKKYYMYANPICLDELDVRDRKHKRHAHLQKYFSCSPNLQIRKRLCSL